MACSGPCITRTWLASAGAVVEVVRLVERPRPRDQAQPGQPLKRKKASVTLETGKCSTKRSGPRNFAKEAE